MNFINKIKSETFYTFLSSYIVLLMVPLLVLSSCSFLLYNNFFRRLAVEQSISDIDRISRYVESHLDRIYEIQSSIKVSNNFRYFAKVGGEYEKYLLKDELSRYFIGDDFVYESFLYIQDCDTVFTNFSTLHTDYFNKQIYRFLDWEEAVFLEDFQTRQEGFVRHTRLQINSSGQPIDTVVFAFPMDNFTESQRAMLIFVVLQSTLDAIISTPSTDYESIMLISEENKLIAASGGADEGFYLQLTQTALPGEQGAFQAIKLEGQPFHVTASTLPRWGWRCVSAIDERALFAPIVRLNIFFIIILAVTCLVSAGLIYYLMKLNYRPVRELYHYLTKHREDAGKQHRALSISFLHTALEEMCGELSELRATLSESGQAIKDFAFSGLLGGEYHTLADYMQSFIHRPPMDLRYPFYTVYIAVFSEEAPLEGQLIEWLESENYDGAAIYARLASSYHYCTILVCSADASSFTAFGNAELLLGKLEAFSKDLLYIGVGTTVTTTGQIRDSFHKALAAIDHPAVKGDEKIISYQSVLSQYSNPVLLQELEAVELALGNRQWRQAYSLFLAQMQGPTGRRLPLYLIKSLAYKITNAALLELGSQGGNTQVAALDAQIEAIVAARNVDAILASLGSALSAVEKQVTEASPDRPEQLVQEIQAYIQEHFASYDFSVANISSEFNRSISYISRQFRQVTGMSILDFTNHVRIAYAKELIAQGNQTLNEIAIAIGYSNDSSFIRMFKKICGITPGRYKEAITRGKRQ